jgi:hypothetical protein
MYKKPRLHHCRNKPMAIIREIYYILEKKDLTKVMTETEDKRKGAPRQPSMLKQRR